MTGNMKEKVENVQNWTDKYFESDDHIIWELLANHKFEDVQKKIEEKNKKLREEKQL